MTVMTAMGILKGSGTGASWLAVRGMVPAATLRRICLHGASRIWVGLNQLYWQQISTESVFPRRKPMLLH